MIHPFILSPGTWTGKGTIKFSESPDWLKFSCRWTIQSSEEGIISCIQEVEIDGLPETMQNIYSLTQITPSDFSVHLENALFGQIQGKGLIDSETIAWEFRNNHDCGFEGFEIYHFDGDHYTMRAEYASIDQNRTQIKGTIWPMIAEQEPKEVKS